MGYRHFRPVAAVLGILLFIASCSGLDSVRPARSDPAGQERASEAPRRFDPPSRFGASVVPLPAGAGAGRFTWSGKARRPAVALVETTAWTATVDRLEGIDVVTGSVVGSVVPGGDVGEFARQGFVDSSVGPPAVVRIGGRDLVVAPFITHQRGEGTTAGHDAITLIAVDSLTGLEVWRLEVATGAEGAFTSFRAYPVIHEAEDGVAVISLAGNVAGLAVAVDLGSRKVMWTKRGPRLVGVGSGVVAMVAGETYERVEGFSVSDGTPAWVTARDSYGIEARQAGPRYLLIGGNDYDSGDEFLTMVDMATGRAVKPPRIVGVPDSCVYDETSVVVCHNYRWGSPTATAIDAETGKELWHLPDSNANRVSPTITAAWHGAVYGKTTDGEVVLDATTGKDEETEPGAAPYVVNEYAGVVANVSAGSFSVVRTHG